MSTRIDDIMAKLEGSTNTLESVCRDYDITENDLTPAELQILDMNIRVCESCGWWCALEELNEEGDCQDCARTS